jgi:hypothetical protein
MAYLVLLLVVAIYSTSLSMSYTDSVRESKYFYPLSLVCSFCIGSLWVIGVRFSKTTEGIFFFSLCWEFAVIITDYVIPLVFFGLNANKYVTLGSLIVAVGLTIMKLNMK